MLIFFWKTAAGGSVGIGQVGGQATVTGVGQSTGGPVTPGIALKLLVEIGIGNNGTSLRRTLINQADVVGCWTHSEQVTEYGSRDISGLGNDGVYEGTGLIQGITVDDIAEGGIATRFSGTQQVRVPNDGLTGGRNLSFAGGSFDIFLYFRTSVNDANQRGLATKFHNPTNTGWAVYLQNGRLTGRLVNAGTEIFSLTTTAFVSDGLFTRAHLCYTPETGTARWTIKGTLESPLLLGGGGGSGVWAPGAWASGAWASGAWSGAGGGGTSAEPIPNASDVIFCGWSHLSTPTTRFIGDLHYVMLGREGKVTLGAEAEACLPWTDISDHVTGLEISVGDQNNAPLGSTATTGRAHLRVQNFNPIGRYSPGHASALNGFNLANPVRIRWTDGTTVRPLYRGFISDIVPTTGVNNDRMTAIDCVDWTEVLAVSPIGPIDVVRDKTSDYCIRRLMDVVNRPPPSVDVDLGNEMFPFAFDQVNGVSGKVLHEVAEINYNEGGSFFIKRDGTVRVESRQRRQLPTAPVATLFGDWQDMDAGMGLHDVINTQRATVYPRESGNSVTTVVAGTTSSGSTPRRHKLTPGVTVPIQGSYRDPEERATSVGATDIQPLIAGVDYTMTEFEDGSGADLTSYVSFVSGNPPPGGSSYNMQVLNTHPFLIGWFHVQVRGRILRRFEPQTTFFTDPDSENQFFPREPPTLNLRYLSEIEAGFSRCKFMVNVYKTPRMRPRVFTTMLDPKSTVMTNFLDFELGSLVRVSEVVSGLSSVDYWIQAMTYSFRENNICTMTVSLVPSVIGSPIFIVGDAELGIVGTAVVGY